MRSARSPFGGTQSPPAAPAPAPEPVATQTAVVPEPPVAPANGDSPTAPPHEEPVQEDLPAPAAEAAQRAPAERDEEPVDEPEPEVAQHMVFDVDALLTADEAADPSLATPEPPIAESLPAVAPPSWRHPPREHVEWESSEPAEAELADELAQRRPRRQRTRLQKGVILVGVLAVAAVPTVLYLQNRGGSGGTSSDERVFARPGAPFTFHYPAGWKEISVKPGAALNKPTYSMELGLDQQDLIGAQTYAVRFDVKPDGSAVDRASGRAIPRVELQRDIDVRLEQIGKAAGMTRIDAPATGKLGELPARIYHYRGQGATSTFYVAFQNATEYFVNCHAGSQPAATKEACDLVTSTFATRP